MAAVAPVLFPEMKRRGSKPGELVAILSASGAMSETIPPSLVLITIGSVTGGCPISALFTGGLVPAVVLAICAGNCRLVADPGRRTCRRSSGATGRQIARSFVIAFPALVPSLS